MESTGIVVIIDYRALPGREEAARGELEALVATVVREERDCGGIRVLRDGGDPARIRLVEHWSSREAYLGPHMETPHIKAFIARAGELVAGPPDTSFWHDTGGA